MRVCIPFQIPDELFEKHGITTENEMRNVEDTVRCKVETWWFAKILLGQNADEAPLKSDRLFEGVSERLESLVDQVIGAYVIDRSEREDPLD